MKKITLFILGIFILLILSELANFLNKSDSPSSNVIITLLINESIAQAKDENLTKSISALSKATQINVYGEYFTHKRLTPFYYRPFIDIPNNEVLENRYLNYLKNIKNDDLRNDEDSGLGRIYYDLGLLSYDIDHILTEKSFQSSVYNNPDFPAFHAELINYYYLIGNEKAMLDQLDNCLKFDLSKILCESYREDSLKLKIPKALGYLKEEVEQHYKYSQ